MTSEKKATATRGRARPGQPDPAEIVGEGMARIQEVQEYLALSRSEVYRMLHSGELPYVKVGERAVRVPWKGLREYAARRLVPAAAG